jgi:hypothetical protein
MKWCDGGWIRSPVALLAVAGISTAASGLTLTLPAGSTVWMHAGGTPCADAGDSDCVASNVLGPAPPNGIPAWSLSSPLGSASFYAEILPARVRSRSTGNPSVGLHSSFVDTYSVHGSAVGTFPVTVTFAGSGTASSVPVGTGHRLVGANARLEIGTWDPSTGNIAETGRVVGFTPGAPSTAIQSWPTTVQSTPFQLSFALSASHTLTTSVGNSFTLAYGQSFAQLNGTIDMTDAGATIAFDLPEGVWLTSTQGGVFGDPPAPQVPLPPLALGWTAGSLAALGCWSLRRRSARARIGGSLAQAAMTGLLAWGAAIVSPAMARADGVTWATGWPSTSGATVTLSLGGGTTVDVTVTTGGIQGLDEGNIGALGAPETGLDYSAFNYLAIYNGGGAGNVTTTLTFENFQPSPGHVRGFLMIGTLHEASVPVTASSVGSAVQGWSQVGSTFPISAGNSDLATWNAASGEFSTDFDTDGNDSSGIVVDVGSLSQYGTITLTHSQLLNDGVIYSMGEETAPEIPVAPGAAVPLLAALLALSGAGIRRRAR